MIKRNEDLEKHAKHFYEYYRGDDLEHEYIAFSVYFQDFCINRYGYIINTGNYRTVNRKLISLLERKRKKHPILWKIAMLLMRVD